MGEKGTSELADMFKRIYEEGARPAEFTKEFIKPLPKKVNAIPCEEYRTISVITHTPKILLRDYCSKTTIWF